MKQKSRGVILVCALFSTALVLGLLNKGYSKVQPGAEPEPLFKTDKYSRITHYMHEIYEHYTVAGKLVKKGDIDMAIVHLKALEYYIDLMPSAVPNKNRKGEPINKKLFTKNFDELRKFSVNVRKALEAGEYAKGKPLPPPDVVTKTCDECHKNQKIPPPW